LLFKPTASGADSARVAIGVPKMLGHNVEIIGVKLDSCEHKTEVDRGNAIGVGANAGG
jgi:hypothetical protein